MEEASGEENKKRTNASPMLARIRIFVMLSVPYYQEVFVFPKIFTCLLYYFIISELFSFVTIGTKFWPVSILEKTQDLSITVSLVGWLLLWKKMTKKSLGRKESLFLFYNSHPIIVRAEHSHRRQTLSQELVQRPGRILTYRLAIHGSSVCFFIISRKDHKLRGGSAHSDLQLPHINHQSRPFPMVQSSGSFFLIQVFSSQMTPSYDRLT